MDPQVGMDGDIRPTPKGKAIVVKQKIVQAIQAAKMSKEAGNIPGEITLLIDQFLNPPLPWDKLVSRWFTERDQSDYSWRMPSRRSQTEYLPSRMSDNGLAHLLYIFDVSGSVDDDIINYCFSQVSHIHKTLEPERITIATFDDIIQNIFELNAGDPFDGFQVTGRGGTNLNPVHKLIQEKKPTAVVIFSDLYCQPMQDPGVPVLWLIFEHPDIDPPAFGEHIHIASEDVYL